MLRVLRSQKYTQASHTEAQPSHYYYWTVKAGVCPSHGPLGKESRELAFSGGDWPHPAFYREPSLQLARCLCPLMPAVADVFFYRLIQLLTGVSPSSTLRCYVISAPHDYTEKLWAAGGVCKASIPLRHLSLSTLIECGPLKNLVCLIHWLVNREKKTEHKGSVSHAALTEKASPPPLVLPEVHQGLRWATFRSLPRRNATKGFDSRR